MLSKPPSTIQTQRLILRPWRQEDLAPFAAMNQDPQVMEYFPSILSPEESAKLALDLQAKIQEKGWGFWAVCLSESQYFIGFIGLNFLSQATFLAPFTPAVEIGWRLARKYWGKGYGKEGALASLQYGFETLKLPEIVSFTAVENIRSRRLMERIGMQRDLQGDFDHPKLPEGHRLRRHVLYRLKAKIA